MLPLYKPTINVTYNCKHYYNELIKNQSLIPKTKQVLVVLKFWSALVRADVCCACLISVTLCCMKRCTASNSRSSKYFLRALKVMSRVM